LWALIISLVVLVAAVLLIGFTRWLRRRRQDRPEGWPALVTSLVGDVLKVLVGLGIVAGLGLHLRFQSKEFGRRQGGVSQRNYQAVKTIWGRPHVQRELDVDLVRVTKKYFDHKGLEFDPEKLKAATQPIAYRARDIEDVIPGNPLLEADHELMLAMNYRRKGNASYPCFEVDGRFSWILENVTGQDVTGKFAFPLPAQQGLVDEVTILVDGNEPGTPVVVQDGALRWRMPLKRGQRLSLEVRYHSRGLDYIRLVPGAGRELRRYRVRMVCRGVQESDINYPIGCMTPMLKEQRGDAMVLGWDLRQAVTRLDMGVILPPERQRGYYVAKILDAAPWALVLLMAMVLVTQLAGGSGLRYVPMLLLAGALDLYYMLMGHVADYSPGLTGGIIIAGLVLTGLTALLWFARAGKLVAVAATVFFVIFAAGYPLIVINEYKELLQTCLYVALLAYTIVLLILQRRPRAKEAGS
jgi:hypothetical protein